MPKEKTIVSEKYHGVLAILLLAVMVLVLYWPVTGYQFIAMDDNLYLLQNPDIRKGISWQGVSWAMTTLYTTNWHPLTWISLMADYELYGLNAAGYHVSNLLLHILNTLLLFLVLRRMTGETWKSLAVASFFAVHPLNIESVVWIAERKNLLSTLFWILALFAYVRYAERPGWLRYMQALFLFALGLTAKPMLVTLPLVLLLMDYWPLRRLAPVERWGDGGAADWVGRWSVLWPLLKEKMPFFLLSLCSAVITFYAAKTGGTVKSIVDFPLSVRIENTLVSFVSYLDKMIWPVDLAIFYPYPATGHPVWKTAMALLFLIAVTIFVALKRKKHPYLVTGWLWYLITLLPVIGLVQVGLQSMANRYAYVPLLGIFVLIAWGIPDLLRAKSGHRVLPVTAVALILIFSFSTWAQLPHWQNSEAAFQYALKVTENNFIAHNGMGDIWQIRGDYRMARLHYREALRIQPGYAEVHNNLAVILFNEGRFAEAGAGFREALKYKPDLVEAHNNLGMALIHQKKFEEAAAHFSRALELKPDYAMAKANLAKLLNEGKLKSMNETD